MSTNLNFNSDEELQRLVDQALDDWKAPEVSSSFDQNLLAKIRAEKVKPSFLERFFTGWRWTAAAIPALGLATAIYFWPTPATTTLEPLQPIQANELAEVERTLDDLEALQALHLTETPQGML